jgi:hypothetical protein
MQDRWLPIDAGQATGLVWTHRFYIVRKRWLLLFDAKRRGFVLIAPSDDSLLSGNRQKLPPIDRRQPVQEFVFRENIAHYKRQLETGTDPHQRAWIEKLLHKEEAKLASHLAKKGEAG